MSEASPSRERDLRRPEWQRSVGAAVFMQMADEMFGDGMVLVPPPQETTREGEWRELKEGREIFWFRLHRSLRYALHARRPGTEYQTFLPDAIEEGFADYTHLGSSLRATKEGIDAQVSFTLNLAQLIGDIGEERGIPEFEIGDYEDVATMLRRDDFRAMINTALLTKNGVWRRVSTEESVPKKVDPDRHESVHDAYSQTQWLAKHLVVEPGRLDFDDELKGHLLEELRRVNRDGMSKGPVNYLASSGCPAAHKQATFLQTEEHQAALQTLAKYYGMTPEQLTAARETSPVEDGLRFMADVIEKFDQYGKGDLLMYHAPKPEGYVAPTLAEIEQEQRRRLHRQIWRNI